MLSSFHRNNDVFRGAEIIMKIYSPINATVGPLAMLNWRCSDTPNGPTLKSKLIVPRQSYRLINVDWFSLDYHVLEYLKPKSNKPLLDDGTRQIRDIYSNPPPSGFFCGLNGGATSTKRI